MAVLLISHDLGVIAKLCGSVKVMYLGQIVEQAPPAELFANPLHPYTQGLVKSIPPLSGDRQKELYVIKGSVPSLENIPPGCRFADRCPFAEDRCFAGEPVELRIATGSAAVENCETRVKCLRYNANSAALPLHKENSDA
jgi:oligopeptide/dipeptide ABC transporter ATP-binding protein